MSSIVLKCLSHLPSLDKGLVLIGKLKCKKTIDSENRGGRHFESGCAKDIRSRNQDLTGFS